MKVQSIGYQHFHGPEFVIDRPTGSCGCLFLLIHTPAVFLLNGVEQVIHKNSCIIFAEGTQQYYRAYGNEYKDDWFHFICDPEDVELINSLGIPFDTMLDISNMNELSRMVQSMWYEFYNQAAYSDEIETLLYRALLLRLSRNLNAEKSDIPVEENKNYQEMQYIRNQIYNEPQQDWSIDKIAKDMAMSRSGIQHRYKKVFGVSISEDIITGRIARVKYYLLTTTDKLDDIAAKCGYTNEGYLMRQFKEKCGMTPTQYRKNAIKPEKK